jgi:N-methylhydantoinase B
MPNPIQLELFRNLFEAAAEEMGITLQRVAFSANIKERRDFSCALFSPAADLLAQAAHIPVHLGSMPASVAAVLQTLGPLHPGDVAIVNDPFQGGTHLPDITLVTPIFAKGLRGQGGFRDQGSGFRSEAKEPPVLSSLNPEPRTLNPLIGYAANRAHHADVGGLTPGSMTLSRHIDEEGVRIQPSLLVRAGQRDDAVLNQLLSAVRTPAERLGDLEAQIAANHVGAAALARMIDRHGIDSVTHYSQALLDYSQSFMSRTIAAITPGEYRFEDTMDDDGAGGPPIPIRVTLTIQGDRAIVDFRATTAAAAGCINCPQAVTRSAVYYCFACLLEEHVPLNGGAFRNIEVLTHPGSLLHAEYPAAVVAGNTETSQRVVDAVFGALAKALPEKIPAASCGTMSSIALGTKNWTYYETIGGGAGAGPTFNGASAVQCHMTNTLNTPTEALELQYPLRVKRFERAKNTGGKGTHTGGDGIIREIEALDVCEGTVLTDRRATQPYGLSGGHPAAPGQNQIRRATGQTEILPGKTQFNLNPGDTLSIRTPGGGGFGK